MASILEDVSYLRHTVNMRYTTMSYKNKKQIKRLEAEWQKFVNTLKPLISQELWNIVQDIRKHKKRPPKQMDTPVEPETALEEDEAILMETLLPPPVPLQQPILAPPHKQGKGRTVKTIRPTTGFYTRFTFCPYDTPPNPGELLWCERTKAFSGQLFEIDWFKTCYMPKCGHIRGSPLLGLLLHKPQGEGKVHFFIV